MYQGKKKKKDNGTPRALVSSMHVSSRLTNLGERQSAHPGMGLWI